MSLRAIRKPNRIEMRPELELVLCCVRSRIGAATMARARILLQGELNWPEVVLSARRHGVTPAFYDGVMASGADLISAPRQKLLRESAQQSVRTSLLLFRELLRIYQLFEAKRIPVIPYKGPVLAWLAYGSFAKREYADLDFAVQQQYIPQATAVLQSAGFSAGFDPREAHGGQEGFAPGQYCFHSSEQFFPVELHTERTMRYFPSSLDFNESGRRLIGVEIAGRNLRTFSVEDTLVMLSVHGAKHFWERLVWILDIAELITAQPVDWLLTMRIAAEMKCSRLLLLGLSLGHDLFGASLPQSVLETAQRDANVQWLARKVREQYAGVSGTSAGVLPRVAFRIRSRDGIGQGVRHMLRLTISATESDRQALRLPRLFAPLYALVRPWRLLRDYGLVSRPVKCDIAHSEPISPEVADQMPEGEISAADRAAHTQAQANRVGK